MAVTKEECSLSRRIATGGPDTIAKCISILRAKGYSAPQTREELHRNLTELVSSLSPDSEVFAELADAHPDKEFILQNSRITQELPAVVVEKMNDCGCSGKRNDTGTESNQVGVMPAPGKLTAGAEILNSNVVIVVLSVVLLGGAAVFFSVLIRALNPQK